MKNHQPFSLFQISAKLNEVQIILLELDINRSLSKEVTDSCVKLQQLKKKTGVHCTII